MEHTERKNEPGDDGPSADATRGGTPGGTHGSAPGGTQGGTPDGPPAATRRSRPWVKPVVIFLLLAIPAGYLYISAMQSRKGSTTKREEAVSKGLEEGWPSKVQRRIYGMTVPAYATDVAHYETNSWRTSSLYLQFTTNRKKLDKWLKQVGTNRAALQDGRITIDADEAAVVGWKFGSGHHWKGTVREQDKPKPNFQITANMDNPDRPRVFVISTVTP
ncbi:hypothetical protein LE181_00825 [Streptomyces sp. SCA3-4]|uniref:hypothetical protein n=1 Tax=Streptomyces sichuanensis TaxID=2871810 RepID=UPI001CE34370|nr:hypothetical protein [Streptomyces sichuanensis]MCA6090726.1 hypothetical protein [Streptomyces sichuanensis]